MRSPLDILRKLPVIRDIAAREQFHAVASVTIQHRREFVAANLWCRTKWKSEQQHYRVIEGSRRRGNGTFAFDDEAYAVEFKLKFG